MRKILYILVVSVIALAAAFGIAALPGHVSGEIGDTQIEAGTPVIVLGLIVAFALLYVLVRWLTHLVRLPRHYGRWRTGGRQRIGDAAVTSAMVALAGGNSAAADRAVARARRALGDTPQTLMLAASAARLAGREDAASDAFRALAKRKDAAAFLGHHGLLRQAIAREDWTEASALARQAESAQPGTAWLRQQRSQLAISAGNWNEAFEHADPKSPRAALAAAAAQSATAQSWHARRLARRAWKEDPTLAAAALAYAGQLRASGKEEKAQAVIRQTWTLAPQPDLADFALAPLADKEERLKAARQLTEPNPDTVESQLLLARTALLANQIAEARRHAEAAKGTGLNQRRLWLLFADIAETENPDSEEGRIAMRNALRQAAVADPDPGWQCSSCRTVNVVWAPACPACGAVGTLSWSAPAVSRNVPALVEEQG